MGLTSNPVVVMLKQTVLKHPERNAVDEIGRVALRSMKNEVDPGSKLEVQWLALVTSEHHSDPQQTGQTPFVWSGLHLSLVSPQILALLRATCSSTAASLTC